MTKQIKTIVVITQIHIEALLIIITTKIPIIPMVLNRNMLVDYLLILKNKILLIPKDLL